MRRLFAPLVILLLTALLLPLTPRVVKAESFHGLFDYEVIKQDNIETKFGTKHTMDIQLGSKIRTKALETFAKELFNKTTSDYVIFTFYIPGQTVGAGAWASAVSMQRSPLKVTITGTTLEEDMDAENAASANKPSGAQYVGKWKDPVIGCIIELFVEEGKIIMHKTYGDGSVWKKELKHTLTNGKHKLAVPNSDTGDYFLLTDSGTLSVNDTMGPIATYTKIKFNKGIIQ